MMKALNLLGAVLTAPALLPLLLVAWLGFLLCDDAGQAAADGDVPSHDIGASSVRRVLDVGRAHTEPVASALSV